MLSLVKKIDGPKVLAQILFKERLRERLDWITSKGPFHSAFLWFKELDHRLLKTFSHTQLCEWRTGTEVVLGWRTDKKSVGSFSKQRSKGAKTEQPRKVFASFLLFSQACLEATFYVIYLKIEKYSWIVNRWAIVEVLSSLSDVSWQGLLTFPLLTKISHEAPSDFSESSLSLQTLESLHLLICW